eukprot:1226541-Pyramimonas_sp.AAC.1
MQLCMRVAEYQLAGGRFFALEHPDTASSWHLECARVLCQRPEVQVSKLDQCMHGLWTGELGPAKKPTR